MRVVLDTNTFVSALLWQGSTFRLLSALCATNGVELFTSPALLAELAEVLVRPKLASRFVKINRTPEQLLADVTNACVVLHTKPLSTPVCRDPDDDAVLACALAAGADFVVSGDMDLLSLNQFCGIAILSAPQAIARLERLTE